MSLSGIVPIAISPRLDGSDMRACHPGAGTLLSGKTGHGHLNPQIRVFVILRGAEGAVAESMPNNYLAHHAPRRWILRLQSLRSLRAE